MTAEEILAAIQDRHNNPTPRGRDVRKMDKPYTCREAVFTCSNGWRIEKLPADDWPLEGWLMGHCLGGQDAGGSHAEFSLREPDGTPHVTIVGRQGLHGRCNAYPKSKYVELINEWHEVTGTAPNPLEPSRYSKWGLDKDDDYHERGVHSDQDYRDLPGGAFWRDPAWHSKRAA